MTVLVAQSKTLPWSNESACSVTGALKGGQRMVVSETKTLASRVSFRGEGGRGGAGPPLIYSRPLD